MAIVIPIKRQTKEQLAQIKADEEHTTYDSLIRTLLFKAGYTERKVE